MWAPNQPLFLAPMAGVTDLAYRLLASECGADYTVTEFTAASGLTRRNTNSSVSYTHLTLPTKA